MFHFSMICSDFLPGSNVAHIENKETHVNKNRSRFFRLFLNIGRIKSFFGMGGVTDQVLSKFWHCQDWLTLTKSA